MHKLPFIHSPVTQYTSPVVYWKSNNGELMHKRSASISDLLQHDVNTVYDFNILSFMGSLRKNRVKSQKLITSVMGQLTSTKTK